MERQKLLTWLAREIVSRKQPGRPLKVAIDGRCAAGKSVLARELAEVIERGALRVLHPSVDGFHHTRAHRYRKGENSAIGYYEDAFDYQTVIDYLLQPLSEDVFPAPCRQSAHNVVTDMREEAIPVSVSKDTVLLFEGLFLFRQTLDAWWDFRILLDVDAATCLSRDLLRDTGTGTTADVLRRKFEVRYEPAWQIYMREEQPRSKADVVVDNRQFSRPVVLKPTVADSQ